MSQLEPGSPEEHGVSSETPELTQIEAARLLANKARPHLQAEGLPDDEIRQWAETFVAEKGGTADVADFVDWIAAQQQ